MDSHSIWAYVHILLFVCWLGADVGLYLVMIFVKNPELGYETRATRIRLAFYIDQFPRVCFALILPVGMQLARDLELVPIPGWLLALGWMTAIAWSLLHLALVRYKGTPLARQLLRITQFYELLLGGFFVALGTWSLYAGTPIAAGWFALKLLLFGLVFWAILGIDTVFQPFTAILRMGPGGSTPEREAVVTRATHQTMGLGAAALPAGRGGGLYGAGEAVLLSGGGRAGDAAGMWPRISRSASKLEVTVAVP